MKRAQISLFGLLFGLISACYADAQPLCGMPSVNLFVRDIQGRGIEDAFVQLIPATVNDTAGEIFTRSEDDNSIFRIDFKRPVKGEYRLIISSPTHEIKEEPISFSDCVSRIVHLIPNGTKTGVVGGTIYDEDKKAVLGSKEGFGFLNDKDVWFWGSEDERGRYEIRLPFGKYRLEKYHWSLRQYFICREFTVDRERMNFDIFLREMPEKSDHRNEKIGACF
ncbi:MAG: hypothetical protein R2747_24555 [Pyrinomonadaceae bacterium]